MLAVAVGSHKYLRLGPASTEELARRLGAGEATVRRAMNWLREIGAPVATARGPGSCWSLAAGWDFPLFKITDDGDLSPVTKGAPPC
jgi:predicted DNA-binding transcriptional regulator YafY